jgi:hypothetical protein
MIVGQVLEKYIDSSQNIVSTLYFVRAIDYASALAAASSMSQVLQSVSNVTFLDQSVHFDVEPVRRFSRPRGRMNRQLIIYCVGTPDAATGRRFTYKIKVIDPDPDILDQRQIRFDPDRPRSLLFINGFLRRTSDIYGNTFDRIVGSEVIEF